MLPTLGPVELGTGVCLMTFANTQNSQRVDNESSLYRLVWRWHFYAGIFCIPFILSLSISGAIYLFKPQIDT